MITGLIGGMTADEIRHHYDLTAVEYDTTADTARDAASWPGVVLAMRRAPYRTSDLTALLDALEQDLLDVPAAELHDAQRETGRAWETSCQEIRSMLNEVIAATEDDVAAATPISAEAATTAHWH